MATSPLLQQCVSLASSQALLCVPSFPRCHVDVLHLVCTARVRQWVLTGMHPVPRGTAISAGKSSPPTLLLEDAPRLTPRTRLELLLTAVWRSFMLRSEVPRCGSQGCQGPAARSNRTCLATERGHPLGQPQWAAPTEPSPKPRLMGHHVRIPFAVV